MKNKTVQFITRTAILLALCVVLQLLIPATVALQLVKGSLVNLVLLIATFSTGLACGLIIAVVNPLFVFLLTTSLMNVCPQILLVVMLGNCILVALAWALRKPFRGILGLAAAAVCKALFMGLSISFVVLPVFGAKVVAAGKAAVAAKMFGIMQLPTALIGGALFFIIWQALKNVPGITLESEKK